MSTAAERTQEKLLQKIAAIRETYASNSSPYQNFLIYGDFGTGKSSLAATAPKPVFIDSFDPGGTKTTLLRDAIERGDVIVDNTWERDSWKAPKVFRNWEQEMFDRERAGFFSLFGTYVLDSITSWSAYLMYEILRKGNQKSGSRVGQTPEIKDYLVQKMTAVDWINRIMAYPCHVIITGHIGLDKDEITGKMETGLLLANKLSRELPNAFDEKYVTLAGKGNSYTLLTRNDGYYRAETRMGGGIFAEHEEPNIQKLLKKANRNWQDRPALSLEVSK